MVEPRRGEVWWVRLDPTLGSEIAKTRPYVILSGNVFNKLRRAAAVIPLSTSPQSSAPLLVPLRCEPTRGNQPARPPRPSDSAYEPYGRRENDYYDERRRKQRWTELSQTRRAMLEHAPVRIEVSNAAVRPGRSV
jgi:hypothetical protein